MGWLRRRTPWLAIAGLLVLVVGAATGSALTAPSHPPVEAASTPLQPVALPTLPTTTEPVPASTTLVPPPVVVPGPTGSTPPTIVEGSACQPSRFAVVLATDKTRYQAGETVQITMSVRNDGPTCTGSDAASSSGPCGLGRATASGESGQEVWDSDGNPYGDETSCPAIGFQPVPSGWSTTVQFSWTQDECTAGASLGPPQTNPECPQTQVAPGTYSLVGNWAPTFDGASHSEPDDVTITQ